jgi:hypothetical protein
MKEQHKYDHPSTSYRQKPTGLMPPPERSPKTLVHLLDNRGFEMEVRIEMFKQYGLIFHPTL